MVNIFLPIGLTYVLGAQKNRLIETVLLSTYNIYFGSEITISFGTHSYLRLAESLENGPEVFMIP